MKQHNASGRYALLDELRGLDLLSMMLYHGCWDLVNLFGIQADWYYGLPGHLWQQSICWVFILLSGFCVQLGHHTLRRGAQVFGAGAHRCLGQGRLSRQSRCFLCRRTELSLVC